jgi:non-heme chloroperoxidase
MVDAGDDGRPQEDLRVHQSLLRNGLHHLKKFDVPTLIIHGDDDQVVPIDAAGRASAKIIKGAKLIVYPGAPHGITDTHKDRLNADLLEFIKG